MAFFKDIACPVCDREFVDGDDIVTCPECGTPHHRECYNLIGHCVNKGLHKADYNFYDEHKKATETKTESQNANEYYIPKDESNSNKTEQAPINPFIVTNTNSAFDNDSDTISGETVADVAATVRINAAKYISKFKELEKKNKKISWNWSAFIFGPLFLFYRKINQAGMAFLALIISGSFVGSALLMRTAPNFVNAVMEFYSSSAQGVYPSEEQMTAVMSSPDAKNAVMCTYGIMIFIAVIHLIIGLYANNFYKNKVIKIIKTVRTQLDEGASFSQNSFMGGDMNMSQEQLRKMYLGKKGGTSFFAPMLVVFIFSLIL